MCLFVWSRSSTSRVSSGTFEVAAAGRSSVFLFCSRLAAFVRFSGIQQLLRRQAKLLK